MIASVKAVSKMLIHRGPDSSGEWNTSNIALAHRRLAILDLTSTGAQPIHSRSGRWTLVLNGEIVNFRELRKEIRREWKGTGDAETLVEALDQWDLEALPRLAGMFAFAAWDNFKRRLLLVRDHLGIKPLFYFEESDGSLFFSSTAASLAAQKCLEIDRKSLSCVLTLGYPPVGRTIFKEIQELPPAHFAIWDGKERQGNFLQLKRYWSIPYPNKTSNLTRNDIDEEFNYIFRKVLNQWARSDVPTSILLSSGTDSTAIAVGLASQNIPVKALIGKMPHPDLDESMIAHRTARGLSIPSEILEIEKIEPLDIIDDIVFHSDLPTIDSSQLGTWLLCKNAASFGKVVFTGDGADELFAGYPTHTANALLSSPVGFFLRSISATLGRHIRGVPFGEGPPGWRHKFTRMLKYARYGLPEAAFRWRTLIDFPLNSTLFKNTHPDPWPLFLSFNDRYQQLTPLERALALEVELLLPQGEIARLDRMSMAHSLEARPPFLDHRIAEFAFKIAFKDKWSWFEGGKRPIVRWLIKNFPGWIRQPKKGFNHPVQNWFMGPLGERLLEEISASKNFLSIRTNIVQKMLKSHRQRIFDYSFELWTLLFLLSWIRVHKVSL